MTMSMRNKQRFVVNNVESLTVASVKVLATSSKQSMGRIIDLAVDYFSRKVVFEKDKPLKWSLPDDF